MSIEPAEAPEPRRTGHRGVDLLLGLSAVAISCVSMFVAYHTSHSMERLVQANSWPFLQFGTGNADREGAEALYLAVSNVGTGPARIHEFEMSFDEEPKPAGPTRRSAPARRTRSGRRWWPRARRATPGTGRGRATSDEGLLLLGVRRMLERAHGRVPAAPRGRLRRGR